MVTKSVLFDKSMYANGCIYIADVYKNTGDIFSPNELYQFFHHRFNFLDYHRLKMGFKNYYRKFNVTERVVRPIYPTVINILNKDIKGSKLFYNLLLEDKEMDSIQYYSEKWSKVLPIDVLNLEWKKVFSICFDTVKDNDLIWFQYRILHKILGTKSLLFKMSIAETNNCRNCGLAEETIEHLFFYCEKANEFLSNVYTLISTLTGVTCHFRVEEVLFGIVKRNYYSEPLNVLLLLLKYYIFEASLSDRVFNIPMFICKIKQKYREQEYLAKLNSQQHKFDKKWSLIKHLIQTENVLV